jgi:hypothetical protein
VSHWRSEMLSLSLYLALVFLLADIGSGFMLTDTGCALVLSYCHCNISLGAVGGVVFARANGCGGYVEPSLVQGQTAHV